MGQVVTQHLLSCAIEIEMMTPKTLPFREGTEIYDQFYEARGTVTDVDFKGVHEYVVEIEFHSGPNEGTELYAAYEFDPQWGDRFVRYEGQ